MGVKSDHSNTSTPRDLGRYKNVKSKVASAYTRYNTPNTKEVAPDSDKVKGLSSDRRSSKSSKNSDRGIETLRVSKKSSSDSDSDNESSDESEEKKNTNMKLTSGPARRMHKLLAVSIEMDPTF